MYYNCQNHPISPVRLADSSGFVKPETATVKPEGPSNLTLADDLRLQCDEDMSECTVEVKDIHIQGTVIYLMPYNLYLFYALQPENNN